MQLKKILLLLLILLMCSCNSNSNDNSPSDEQQNNISAISFIEKTADGKTYYCLDGKPFMPIGVQIRTDLLLYKENCEFDVIVEMFTKAKELGVTMVEIPVPWYATETSEGVYNFRDIGKMMTLAKQLGLKIEFLLFSTNTTGWSDNVPDYIKNDSDTYSRYISKVSPNGLFLVQNDPDLLDREGKWLNAMMDSIATWSTTNNDEHVVVSIQIHNESDTFPRFVLSQQQIMMPDNSRRLTDIEAWKETIEAYDYLGKIVKKSKYPCITRVNLAQAYKGSWEDFTGKIFNLEGIDIVGDDTYAKTVAFNKEVILDFNNEVLFNKNNYPHISENDGSYNTVPSLILSTTAIGGGYMIYDLATPIIALDEYGWDDWSILNPRTLEYKPHTELTRKVIKGIVMAGSDYVLANVGDIAAFNVVNDVPQETITQTIQTSHASITFETKEGALGYVITSNEYIDIYFTASATLKISNVVYENKLYSGSVDLSGIFVENGLPVEIASDTFTVEGEQFYRLKVSSVISTLISNCLENIGG